MTRYAVKVLEKIKEDTRDTRMWFNQEKNSSVFYVDSDYESLNHSNIKVRQKFAQFSYRICHNVDDTIMFYLLIYLRVPFFFSSRNSCARNKRAQDFAK